MNIIKLTMKKRADNLCVVQFNTFLDTIITEYVL